MRRTVDALVRIHDSLLSGNDKGGDRSHRLEAQATGLSRSGDEATA